LEVVYACVLDAKMTYLAGDPFGDVCSGSLKVRCSGLLAGKICDWSTVNISSDDLEARQNEEWPISRDYLAGRTIDKEDDTVYLMPMLGGGEGALQALMMMLRVSAT
jgi:hypothetical protein